MDSNLKKKLRALSLELRHILERDGETPGDLTSPPERTRHLAGPASQVIGRVGSDRKQTASPGTP